MPFQLLDRLMPISKDNLNRIKLIRSQPSDQPMQTNLERLLLSLNRTRWTRSLLSDQTTPGGWEAGQLLLIIRQVGTRLLLSEEVLNLPLEGINLQDTRPQE